VHDLPNVVRRGGPEVVQSNDIATLRIQMAKVFPTVRVTIRYFCSWFVILLCALCAHGQVVAELPRVHVDTSYTHPDGSTIFVGSSGELQPALNASHPGDVIVLEAGVTYTGAFQLPAKTQGPTAKWIYVISSRLANLPTGKRVAPSDAVNMPKVVTPDTRPAFQINGGANHFRLVGLEISSVSNYTPAPAASNNGYTYYLIGSEWRATPQGDSIVVDRCYIHGSDGDMVNGIKGQDIVTAFQGNGSNYALIDSYVSAIHAPGQDAQAFAAFDTPGPIKITNNYLEAAGENVMFGGAGKNFNHGVPSDITITGNHLYKPLSWAKVGKGGTIPPGNQWVVKNSFECKSCLRVLFDGNIIENVWVSGQLGFAVMLTVRSGQSGDFAVVKDLTITNNIIKNVVSGFNSLAKDDTCGGSAYADCKSAGSQSNWYIVNNLITFFDPSLPGGSKNIGFLFSRGIDRPNGGIIGVLQDIVLQHNTMVSSSSTPCWSSIYFSAGGSQPVPSHVTNDVWILDNVLCRQPNGDHGLRGTEGLNMYMGDPPPVDRRFKGNVMFAATSDLKYSYPPTNTLQARVSYVDPSADNYQLASPTWIQTTDGTIAGVNESRLSAARKVDVTSQLAIQPDIVTLRAQQTAQFMSSATASSWSLKPPTGSITAGGLYTAPKSVAGNSGVTVCAVTRDPKPSCASIVLVPSK
jgi:hypothetical protein